VLDRQASRQLARDLQTVLVHAGASGVGLAALQICASLGANAICTVGSPEKMEATRAVFDHTAQHASGVADAPPPTFSAFDRHDGDFAGAVLEATNHRGVDVVLDFVGADYWQSNLKVMAPDSTLISLGFLSGVKAPAFNMAPIITKRLSIVGSSLRARPLSYKGDLSEDLGRFLLPRLDSGEVVPNVYATYPVSRVAEAHAEMEANKNIGKIVLTMDEWK
jgi:NADPH:quinone reductase-like Zn-dependent oxidoreductase